MTDSSDAALSELLDHVTDVAAVAVIGAAAVYSDVSTATLTALTTIALGKRAVRGSRETSS